MQPLKITIYGDFWDVQIYKDRLYLWDMNGDLYIYNWGKSIKSMYNKNKFMELPIICGFSRGDYLYNSNFDLIYEDSEIKNLIIQKFDKVSSRENVLDLKTMALRAKQKNPFSELQTESEIHYDNIYAVMQKGLWSAKAHRSSSKYPVSSRPKKIWDCPNMQSIKANSRRLLLSGGSEGLFEFFIDRENFYPSKFRKIDDKIIQLSDSHSLISAYAFSSIYSTSNIDDSFLMANYWDREDNNWKLKFDDFYKESDIFSDINKKEKGFSWAENEKIYYIKKGLPMKVSRFTQGNINKSYRQVFRTLDNQYSNDINEANIVSAGVAQFGTIIEDLNGLTILQSDGNEYRINGDVIRWRVYPRSRRYMNHLHVILNDRIEIYSFNQDYFIDQKTKIFGIKPVKSEN